MSSLEEESEIGVNDNNADHLQRPRDVHGNAKHDPVLEVTGPIAESSVDKNFGDGDELESDTSVSQLKNERRISDVESQDNKSSLVLRPGKEHQESRAQSPSIPDDTPSVQDSVLSSPSTSVPASHTPEPHSSPTPSLRPFDRRFLPRIPSSDLITARTLLPASNTAHARHSSLFKQELRGPSEADDSPTPWEVIRWAKLRKITGHVFSEVGRRTFGRPTCISVSASIALGTSKGIILIFDYHQNLRSVIGPGSKAVESGSIDSLAISADHTTVAGGHANGSIFTWDITQAARPVLHIQPLDVSQLNTRKIDAHVSGVAVVHLGFQGTRNTALVSADEKGMAFCHKATRGLGAVARSVKTTRILGRYPSGDPTTDRSRKPSSVLAFSPLPLGNVEQQTDSMGLVAMLTPYLLVIVSTTPVAQTQYKAVRPKDIAAHGAMSGCLAWFPALKLKTVDKSTAESVSKAKLIYCWSNVLALMDIGEEDITGPQTNDNGFPGLQFRLRSRWKAEESIVAVQWLSRSVIGVLTITQRLIIIEDHGFKVAESFDLLQKQIYHRDVYSKQLQPLVDPLDEDEVSMHGVVADAFCMSFKVYKGRIFLLGFNDLSIGTLSNWADRLLALMEIGDFIGAIRLATTYYDGEMDRLTVGLPDESSLRHSVVQEKLLEMMSASLKFAFGKNRQAGDLQIEKAQLADLAAACFSACVSMGDMDFLFDEAYCWYENGESRAVFFKILEPYILKDEITILPPAVVKKLITYYSSQQLESRLEAMLCHMDTATMDIDQVTTLCKQHDLYDALIHIWNQAIGDFITPFQDVLSLITPATQASRLNSLDSLNHASRSINAQKMFPYMSHIFTGRIYPTGDPLPESTAIRAKAQLYSFIFSGKAVGWPPTAAKLFTSESAQHFESPFPYLRIILDFDTSSFLSVLNEAFEDSFLNGSSDRLIGDSEGWIPNHIEIVGLSMNRQHIVSILLDVLNEKSFGSKDTIYLDMFIARNLPKFPQFLLLSGTSLHKVLIRLCNYPAEEIADDCQLSVEYLLSVYHPSDLETLLPMFERAGFFRVLKSSYRSNRQYAKLLETYFEDTESKATVFDCIGDCLRPGAGLSAKQIREVIAVLEHHAQELADIDIVQTAKSIDTYAPSSHASFVDAFDDSPDLQYRYLKVILDRPIPNPKGSQRSNQRSSHGFVERYIRLLCQYESQHVIEYVNDLESGDIQLEYVLPAMESTGVIDAAVVLMAKEGKVRDAMDRLTKHLGTLEAALLGLLSAAGDSPDVASSKGAAADIVEALQKYSRVGVWLCRDPTGVLRSPVASLKKQEGNSNPSSSKRDLTNEELLWLDLIDTIVCITTNVSTATRSSVNIEDALVKSSSSSNDTIDATKLIIALRSTVQEVFSALLNATTYNQSNARAWQSIDSHNLSFVRILRAFLSRASSVLTSLSDLRAVLAGVFSSYSYEESLLALANRLLDEDSFVHVADIAELRQRGWRPRSQACGGCGRKTWGSGAGINIWEAWAQMCCDEEQRRSQAKQNQQQGEEAIRKAWRGKSKDVDDGGSGPSTLKNGSTSLTYSNSQWMQGSGDRPEDDMGPLIVFACRHTYHRICLERLRQSDEVGSSLTPFIEEEALQCPTCG